MERRAGICLLLAVASVAWGVGRAQKKDSRAAQAQSASAPTSAAITLAPMKNAATVSQIRDYLRVSGDMEIYRKHWMEAVDAKRSDGKPYWPESFWTAIKSEIQKTDLTPSFVMILQHGVSKKLMKKVLKVCRSEGAEQCRTSPEYGEFYDAEEKMKADTDRVQQAMTNEIVQRVYEEHKPEINAALAKYMAEHPGWKDR
jgi:hypothetical protein